MQFIKKSLSDYITLPMILLSFGPLLFGIIFWSWVLFGFSTDFSAMATVSIDNSLQLAQDTSWLQKAIEISAALLVHILLAGAVVFLVLITNALFAAFYAPIIINFIKKRHYPNLVVNGDVGISEALLFFFGTLFKFLFIMIVLIPLYFIPVIGFFISLIPYYWFFQKIMIFDVGETLFSKGYLDEFRHKNRTDLFILLLPLYLLNFVPFLNIFVATFQILVLSHFMAERSLEDSGLSS